MTFELNIVPNLQRLLHHYLHHHLRHYHQFLPLSLLPQLLIKHHHFQLSRQWAVQYQLLLQYLQVDAALLAAVLVAREGVRKRKTEYTFYISE